jgi:hypothetical protein
MTSSLTPDPAILQDRLREEMVVMVVMVVIP